MSKVVCKICVAMHGLSGASLEAMPDVGDEDAMAKHIESEHHIPVIREDETTEEGAQRFRRENPDAGTDKCKCPFCLKSLEGQRAAMQFLVDFEGRES